MSWRYQQRLVPYALLGWISLFALFQTLATHVTVQRKQPCLDFPEKDHVLVLVADGLADPKRPVAVFPLHAQRD